MKRGLVQRVQEEQVGGGRQRVILGLGASRQEIFNFLCLLLHCRKLLRKVLSSSAKEATLSYLSLRPASLQG